MIGMARSTYYHRPKKPSVLRQLKEADLRDRIEQIVVEYPASGVHSTHCAHEGTP